MSGTGSGKHSVKANHAVLPEGWYFDQVLRPEVERKVKSYFQQGLTNPQIARQVGCSDRSVLRILKRLGLRR